MNILLIVYLIGCLFSAVMILTITYEVMCNRTLKVPMYVAVLGVLFLVIGTTASSWVFVIHCFTAKHFNQ